MVILDKLFSIRSVFIYSVRPQWKVMLNIDMSYKAFFIYGSLTEVMYNKYGDNMIQCSRQMANGLRE